MRKRGKNEQNVQIYFFWRDAFHIFFLFFVDLMQKFKIMYMIHVKKVASKFPL